MDTLFSSEQDTQKVEPEASSALSLLEQGLNCIRQGRYSEGIAFFALARERLAPNMMHLTVVIDACIQDYVGYWQAQQVFQQASEHYVKAHAKQQTHATSLEKLLTELVRNTDSDLSATAKESPENQHLPQPLPEDSEAVRLVPTFIGNSPQSISVKQSQPGEEGNTLPALYFSCFGHFEVKRSGQTVSL